jgi:hypothetical protein
MREAAQDFLAQIDDGQPPAIDHSPATTQALRELYPLGDDDAEAEIRADLAESYRYARLALDDARENYHLLTNEVRAAMGNAKRAVSGGAKIAVRSVFERSGVDVKKLRADHPEAYAACRTTTQVDKLSPARAKKEKP